ncbi:MAG: transcription termination factor NusA [Candidatus Saccharimonadales bacterium]
MPLCCKILRVQKGEFNLFFDNGEIEMEMDFKQLAVAIKTIAEEKNLPEESVQEIVEQALAAAYRRDYGDREGEVRVTMNLNTGNVDAYITKEIVEEVQNPAYEILLKDAGVMRKNAKIGETIEVHDNVQDFGRVAAQTAKQVILQRLREAEREVVMEEYEDKIGSALNGVVSRVEGNIIRVDLGRAQGIMPKSEQIQGERYYSGQRLKVFLKEVERGPRGPQLVVSRGSTQFIEWLFSSEVPEMESGAVEIKGIAREAGVRSKIAVASNVQGVDPVGTFVGGHGTRVNAVMSEVGEQEKIDIVVWNDEPMAYITSALSPTKVSKVIFGNTPNKAKVLVPEDQLSIAIGKNGQNVRLASKLTGYELDIEADRKDIVTEPESTKTGKQAIKAPKLKKKSDLENSLLKTIEEHSE